MLNSCLDIFEARMPQKTAGHDFGLLHALDERQALYGWVTNTGVKLVIVIDMEGRPAPTPEAGKLAVLGLKSSDLVSVGTIVTTKSWLTFSGVSGVAGGIYCIAAQPFLHAR